MLRAMLGVAIILTAALGGTAWAADGWRGPTVVLAPGDVSPLRGNIINPLGPSAVYRPLPRPPRPGANQLERDLRLELDRLPSRPPQMTMPVDPGPRLDITADPLGPRALPETQDQIDRARAAAALESFKTLRPNAPPTPLFEGELNRTLNPTDLGQ
jgi:hypothetical protein